MPKWICTQREHLLQRICAREKQNVDGAMSCQYHVRVLCLKLLEELVVLNFLFSCLVSGPDGDIHAAPTFWNVISSAKPVLESIPKHCQTPTTHQNTRPALQGQSSHAHPSIPDPELAKSTLALVQGGFFI